MGNVVAKLVLKEQQQSASWSKHLGGGSLILQLPHVQSTPAANSSSRSRGINQSPCSKATRGETPGCCRAYLAEQACCCWPVQHDHDGCHKHSAPRALTTTTLLATETCCTPPLLACAHTNITPPASQCVERHEGHWVTGQPHCPLPCVSRGGFENASGRGAKREGEGNSMGGLI